MEQERANEVKSLFDRFTLDKLFLSDISLYSIGIILYRLNKKDIWNLFIDNVINRGLGVISIEKSKLKDIQLVSEKYSLDFEDSYQLLLSRVYNLQLISFDKDFDKVEKFRKEPIDVLRENNESKK